MFHRRLHARLLLSICVLALAAPTATADSSTCWEAVPLDGFADGIHHYQNRRGDADYPRLDPADITAIADNVLLHQRSNGGWPANWDPLRILSDGERQELLAQRDAQDTTFDNRSTYSTAEYIAHVFNQTGDPAHRDACLRGLEYILKTQYPNGGWPHSWPSSAGYHPRITIADDVMPGILGTLRKAEAGRAPFTFLDDALRKRCHEARARGDTCLLHLQVVVDGEPTVWAGQYDEATLEPVIGRSYELPGLVSIESVAVVRYLMSIEDPSPGVIRAVECAIRWFERSKITGLRILQVPAEPERYEFHTSTWDRVAVEDPDAPPLWARFYDIPTNRPFLANRDGVKVYSLAEVKRERRTGYDWYFDTPSILLSVDYPAWKARLAGGLPQAAK